MTDPSYFTQYIIPADLPDCQVLLHYVLHSICGLLCKNEKKGTKIVICRGRRGGAESRLSLAVPCFTGIG